MNIAYTYVYKIQHPNVKILVRLVNFHIYSQFNINQIIDYRSIKYNK